MMGRFQVALPKPLIYAAVTSSGALVVSRWRLASRMAADYFRAKHRVVERKWWRRVFRLIRRHIVLQVNLAQLTLPPEEAAENGSERQPGDRASGRPSTK
jgi:hypothetical protein